MQRVAVISDTHIPERATAIPAQFRDRIREADHVIHAGDFTTNDVLADLVDTANGNFTAVSGNMDPRSLDLPAVATYDTEGVTFVVTHGTGNPRDYEERIADVVRDKADEDAVGIAGHTHVPLDTTIGGVRLLNPGSVTGAAPASRTTMMTLTIDEGTLDVELHET